MQLILANAAALAVASIFYVWRAYWQVKGCRQDILRHRVAYMLWVMSERVDSRQESLAAD